MTCIKKTAVILLTVAAILTSAAASEILATTQTVEDQDPAYRYKRLPSAQAFVQPISSGKDLRTDLTVGVAQGVDTNPLLDSTHKADNYTQETLDMRFKYNLPENPLGKLDSRFGFNILNINYFRITDVNLFDGIADINFDQQLSKDLTLSAGYAFEMMWFPNSSDGNYVGNEFNTGFKQNLTKNVYQKAGYYLQAKDYLERKVMLGNGNLNSDLRFDLRNTFRHELGTYIGKKAKVRAINEFLINESNYQYLDFYDYEAYRTGASLIMMFTKKFYGTAGFRYQRKWYGSRTVSVGDYTQKDNLYTAAGSLMYDISKNLSIFMNYTHMENHSNEPLEQYVDTLYYGGFNYSF